tara:strand:+ start:831 stop:1400 length:570 start_codon:yes stop_codon:yes gene_type:complete
LGSKIIISEIKCAEQSSQVTFDGEVEPGDFYNFDNGQLVEKLGEPLDVLFLDYKKEYEIFKNNRYSHSIPFLDSEKEKALAKGKKIEAKEVFVFNFLLLREINEKKSCPYFMVFKGAQLPVGRDLENFYKRMSFNERPFFDIVIEINRKKREGKNYFFFQKTWKEKRIVSSEEKKIAEKWINYLEDESA